MKKIFAYLITLFVGALIFFAGFSLAILTSENRMLSQTYSGAMEMEMIRDALTNDDREKALKIIELSINSRKNILEMSSFLATDDEKEKREILEKLTQRMEKNR